MQPKVSVIVPVYNVQQYIEKCLDSLVHQTLADLQVILVNDGSKDRSGEICREYARQYGNIEYYEQENAGSAAARNAGLDHANGEYVGFVDADDWIEPDMYEKLYRVASEYNADMVLCRTFEDECPGSYEYIFPRPGYFSYDEMQKELLPYAMPMLTAKGNFRNLRWCNWLRIYRKAIIDDHHIRSCAGVSNCEDLGFNTEYMLHSASFYYLDEQLYHNRPNPTSQSRNYVQNMWPRTKKLVADMHRYIDPRQDATLSKAFDVGIFYFFTMLLRNEAGANDKKQARLQVSMMLQDAECQRVMASVTPEGMNREYRMLYDAIASASTRKALRVAKRLVFRKKVLFPMVEKVLKNKIVNKIYRKLRHR